MMPPIMSPIALGSPVNWQSPINRSLIAWWYCIPQIMGGLRWLDLTHRWHGERTGSTANNKPEWSHTFNSLGRTGSINFTAANSNYVPIGGYDTTANDPFTIGAKDFTVCCWIRPTTVTGYQIVIGRDDDSTHRDLIFGFGNTTGCILYMTGRTNPGTATPKETGNVLTTGAWNHIGAMRVGTSLTIWHNGANIYSTTDSETTEVKQGTSLGRRNYSGFPQYYGGRMNDVRYHAGTNCPTPGEIYTASRMGYRNEFSYLDSISLFTGSGTAATNRRRRLLLSRAR